jgi:Flp pilus assembly protein TadD
MSPLTNQRAQVGPSNALDEEADAGQPKALREHEPHFGRDEPNTNGMENGDEKTLANEGSDSQRLELAAIPARWASGGGAYRVIWPIAGGLVMLLLLAGGIAHYVQPMDQPAMVTTRSGISVDALPLAMKSEPTEKVAPEKIATEKPAVAFVPVEATAVGEEGGIIEAENSTRIRSEMKISPKVTRNRAITTSIVVDVMAGYRAYQEGNDPVAERYYRRAIQEEPGNVDAWLGLGAIAQRQGQINEASVCYEHVLDLEPKNLAAQAGLVDLMVQFDPVAGEKQLKSLLAQQPEAAFLHAALGNLYAEQAQWSAAQQAYFQASRLEVSNVEYAFNLAVSLDHANKPEQAETYYRRTLELLAERGGSVERTQIEARIMELEQKRNK